MQRIVASMVEIGGNFGSWKVNGAVEPRIVSGRVQRRWRCRCVCGKERVVVERYLLNGRSQSCGCSRPGRRSGRDHHQYKHGHCSKNRRSKEWRAWNAMIRRCCYPSMDRYPRYGGRGITVCERWRHSFEAFLKDVGYAPSPEHTIDRIDNDGNYEPHNVRWATRSEQIRNSTKARHIEFGGRGFQGAQG